MKDLCILGKPQAVIMDNSSKFTGQEFRSLCMQLRINHDFCMPYNPQGNSVLEGAHRTLKSVLAKLSEQHPNLWASYLYETVHVLNESIHLSLGTSPFYVQYGYHPTKEVGKLTLPDAEEDDVSNGKTIQELILENVRKNTQEFVSRTNVKGRDDRLVEGDLAWVYNEETFPGTDIKLNQKWLGPFKVIQVIDR